MIVLSGVDRAQHLPPALPVKGFVLLSAHGYLAKILGLQAPRMLDQPGIFSQVGQTL